jgi:MFS family permease
MGWMAELYRPAVSAAIADLVPARDRARAYARLYWVINLGFALAPTLAGLVASYSYFAIFVVDAITLAGFGLIVLARVRETRPTTAPVLPRSPSGNVTIPGLAVVLRDRTFMGFALLNLGLALVMWQNGAALPLDMRRHGISEATYGVLMAINGVLIIVLQPLMTPLLARLSRTRVLAVAALFFGVGFGLYGLVGTPAGYAVAIAVWTIAEIATLPTSSAVVADLAPAALRGRYQGVYSASWGIASTIGPLVGGGLLFAVGGHALWFGCFGLMLVVTIGHVVLGPARARREAAAHAALAHEHELAQEPARAA